MRWLAALGLIACDPSTAPRDEPAPVVPVVVSKPKPTAPLRIRWVDVRDTPPCFYFSGPDGRDDKLIGDVTVDRAELGDGNIALTINGVTFRGVFRDRELTVKRTSEHTFGGAWTATEEIHGTFVDSTLIGTYSYRECEHDNQCPGHCTIDADIRLER